ncbi:MAG: SDR family oxidoreductase [Pseudomonadota bacterium]
MARPTALITGASSGIGMELARIFAERGYDLILAARRAERLESLASEIQGDAAVHCIPVDLGKARGPEKLESAISELGLTVDVLVNNAGVISTEPGLEEDLEALLNLVNLNVRALLELSHRFGNHMVNRGYGRILNVASVAAFQPIPGMSVYAASKAFVLSLTEGMTEELRGTGVTITALCPGPTKTEMADAFNDIPYAEHFLADARSVAQEGFDAMKAGQVIRVPGLANQAMVNWSQYQPRWLVRTLGGLAARSAKMLRPNE